MNTMPTDEQSRPSNAPSTEDAVTEVTEAVETVEVVGGAGEDGADDASKDESGESDRFYEYLSKEYRRFRMIAWILGICGFSLIFLTVGLSQAGIVSLGIYNVMMSVSYFIILLMAITVFTRTRPFKRRMKQYNGEPISLIRDDSAPDGVRMEEHKFDDMDEMYKILEREVRTEVIPDLPEYRKLRRVWLSIFALAAVMGVASLLLYYFCPQWYFPATFMLLAAFILVIVAFYIDRTRMKPMRNEWARRYDMSEMKMRNNLRAIRKNEYRPNDDEDEAE